MYPTATGVRSRSGGTPDADAIARDRRGGDVLVDVLVDLGGLGYRARPMTWLPGLFVRRGRAASCATVMITLLVLASCGGGGQGERETGDPSETGDTGATGSASEPTTGGEVLPPGCTVLVAPGADDDTAVQEALLDAGPGSTVCLAEGVFSFTTELSISGDGVTLRGAARATTILDFALQDLGANGIKITGDGVTVTGFTVRETPGDGIRGDEVDDIVFADVAVEWATPMGQKNGAYGFYPVGCAGVQIRNSRASGARDAGIYVGQSTDILVEDNEAYGNVAGIEIENSTGATVRNNQVHDNTAGILIFNLPGLPVQGGKRTLAYGNTVENNNGANFAAEGTVVAGLPVGVGFMILAADENEVRGNTIRGNNTTGQLVISYSEVFFGPFDDPTFDAFPEGNYVHDNVFAGNGSAPEPALEPLYGNPAPDMVHDGCLDPDKPPTPALVNCFDNNGAASYLNFDLCGGGMNPSTDLAPVTCQHPALPELPGG